MYPILGTGGEIGRTNTPLYSKPSVLIGRKGSINKPRFMTTPFWTVDTLFYTEISHSVEPLWLYYKFQSIDWNRYSEATGVPSLSASAISGIQVKYPPLPEQRAIAACLGTWDKAIDAMQQLIGAKEERKKWLMLVLLTGRRRIKAFEQSSERHRTGLGELPVEWKLRAMSEVTDDIRHSIVPEKEVMYRQIGIRSHTKGIFLKEEVTGEVLGNKRVFWIEPGCLIVNIVFAWEHAIAKTTEREVGMIASHRFPMYKPKKVVLDLDFLLYYFKSPRGKYLLGLASPGGAGRNKTLGKSEFAELHIPVPTYDEQVAIGKVLLAADLELGLLQGKLDRLRDEKRGLMQVLLTGRKRLNINQ